MNLSASLIVSSSHLSTSSAVGCVPSGAGGTADGEASFDVEDRPGGVLREVASMMGMTTVCSVSVTGEGYSLVMSCLIQTLHPI